MKAIVSLSGGMDSSAVLAAALREGRSVECVSFFYGSKHNEHESRAASAVAAFYKVPLTSMDLSGFMAGFDSALLRSSGENIPEGHHEDPKMKNTVVPGRNIIFVSILAGLAWSWGAEEVWLGVHSGDRLIYPDCRPEFVTAMDKALCLGTDKRVRLCTPYLVSDKATILRDGLGMGVPYALTRTCYTARQVACGRCGACRERLEAFELCGVKDPIDYE